MPARSFAWGPAAAALQQLQPAAVGGATEQQQRQRQQLLQQRLPLDPLRAGLAACHWPEACSLASPGSSTARDSDESGGGQLAQLPAMVAAHDPGFLLPFAVCCLRQQVLTPRAFAEAGLLSGTHAAPPLLCLLCLLLLWCGALLRLPTAPTLPHLPCRAVRSVPARPGVS